MWGGLPAPPRFSGLTFQATYDTLVKSMGTTKKQKTTHEWLFKASWRGTALKFRIEASDLEYAWRKAEREIKRMNGRDSIIDLECLEQTN